MSAAPKKPARGRKAGAGRTPEVQGLIAHLRQQERELTRIRQALDAREHALAERTKELTCLYTLSNYFEEAGTDLRKVFRKVPALVKRSWQYPRICVARLRIDDGVYQSRNFKKTRWCQAADIVIDGKKGGTLEVCYLQKIPGADSTPFLKEEQDLIGEIAFRIGKKTEQGRLRRSLMSTNRRLQATEQQLHAFNQQLQAANQQLRASDQQLRAYNLQLEESETRFRLMFEKSSVGKSLTAPDGRLLKINRAFAAMLGSTVKELQDTDITLLVHPDDLPQSREATRALLGGSEDFGRTEIRYRHKTGAEVWADESRVLVRDEKGEPRYIITEVLNITETRKIRSERETLLATVERSNRELEQFAYVASHDLQEPLRMVASYVELLAARYQDRLDQDARDFIGFAVDGATRMQHLIRDLLSFSRVTSRGHPFETVDTAALLDNVRQSLEVIIEETGAELKVGALPEVIADGSQLERVFQNLIQNAIKFAREGETPVVRITAQRQGDHFRFSVADNGIGIDPEYFDKVFIIFQRLNRKSSYGGTGIGLAVTKRIIERHGGKIWITSVPGQGTTFHFTLPVTPVTQLPQTT